MDLTPDVLADIEFRRKGRGYDAEGVDEFRQQVETWAGEMHARLREATSKLDEAETRAREAEERARNSSEGDETIQRTLLLAQRTADAAVAEAEETASRKVAEAEAEADRLMTEARTHREKAIAEAESEVREAIDLKRAEMLDELNTLERARDAMAGDVAALEVHVAGQRSRLEEVRDQLANLLEHPLAPVTAPALSGAQVPARGAPLVVDVEPEPPQDAVDPPDPFAAPAEDRPEGAPASGESVPEESVSSAPASGESVFGETPAGDDDQDWTAASEDAWGDAPPPPPPPPPPPDLEADDVDWADAPPPPPPPPPELDEPAPATFGGLSGPAVSEQLPVLDDQAEGDNPWLAELGDEESDAEDGGSRFGRRR